MINSKPFKITSIIAGILFLLFTAYLGYGAYLTKEYSRLFIILVMFSIGLTFVNLGAKGKKEAWRLGKRLIGTGIGLLAIAVLLNYITGTTDIKKEISDTMIDTIAKAAAENVKKQLEEQDSGLPQDKETVKRMCQIQEPETDERSFSMNDICKEINNPENEELSVDEIVAKALEKKTRELAEKDVKGEINETKTFDTTFGSMSNTKNYAILFGAIGIILSILGFVFMIYSREEEKGPSYAVYHASISAAIACAINAAIFKLLDFLIKDQLVKGKLIGNAILQMMIPGLAAEGMQQEVTKNLLMKTGQVVYEWLGVALNKAFIFTIILGIASITAIAVTYVMQKNETRS